MREGDGLVAGPVVTPEVASVMCERAGGEGNPRKILRLGVVVAWIEARDAPALAIGFRSAQDVDHSVDERVAADLCAHVELTQDGTAPVELEDALLVPLAQVQVMAVVAQIRACEVRAGEAFVCRESAANLESAHITIVLRTFA